MLDLSEHCDFGSSLGSSVVSTLLLSQCVSAGIFSRITMTSLTTEWYRKITDRFEIVLICLVILEIFVMRYLLILPIDLTKWIDDGVLIGTAVSKRKRRETMNLDEIKHTHRLVQSAFTIIKRIDEEECFLRSLCELQWHRSAGHKLPKQISKILQSLKRIKNFPEDSFMKISNHSRKDSESPFVQLQGAILAGEKGWTESKNSTINCELKYEMCPLKHNEMYDQLSDSYFYILNEF